MRENFKRLQELLKENTNIIIQDMHLNSVKQGCEDLNEEMMDKEFALIRKSKKYDFHCSFARLKDAGFEATKLQNHEGKDEVVVKVIEGLKKDDYCVIVEGSSYYKQGTFGYIDKVNGDGTVEFLPENSDIEVCCPINVLRKV